MRFLNSIPVVFLIVASLGNPFYMGEGWKVSVSIENETKIKEYFGVGYNYKNTNDTKDYEVKEIWIKSNPDVYNIFVSDFSKILDSYTEDGWIKVPYYHYLYKERVSGTVGFFELKYSQPSYDYFNFSSDLFRIKTDKGVLKPLIHPGILHVVLPKYYQVVSKNDGETSKRFGRCIIDWQGFTYASVNFIHPQKAILDASHSINETFKAIENAKKDECLISNVLYLEQKFYAAENLTRKAKIAYFNGSYEKSVNLALKSKKELEDVQNELKFIEEQRERRRVQTVYFGFLIIFLAIIGFFISRRI